MKKRNTKYLVENFEYNGFYVKSKKGFAKWEIKKFLGWTNDPGIGSFLCSDGELRNIPSCQLSSEYLVELPKTPDLKPYEGVGVLFGESATSLSQPNN